jgi:hypothetical protein
LYVRDERFAFEAFGHVRSDIVEFFPYGMSASVSINPSA